MELVLTEHQNSSTNKNIEDKLQGTEISCSELRHYIRDS